MDAHRLTIQARPEFGGANRYNQPFADLDPKRQAMVLLDVFGDVHKDRFKNVGFRTKKARAYFLMRFIKYLNADGKPVRSLLNINQKHLTAFVDALAQRGLSASSLQTDFSCVRWLLSVLGKDGAFKHPSEYGVCADRLTRRYAADFDRSWSAVDGLTDELVQAAMDLDEHVGTYFLLMQHFGLRLTEAIMLKPAAALRDGVLYVDEGTKGGRARTVPILTSQQLEVLRFATELADKTKRKSLIPENKNPESMRQRLYYICRKLGVTRSRLGITPHGLRHEYANNRYEKITGVPSRVRGGSVSNRSEDTQARLQVSSELGHARARITSTYLGALTSKDQVSANGPNLGDFPQLYPIDQIPGLDDVAENEPMSDASIL